MNLLLQIPIEVRLAALFVLGALVAGQLNRGIYRLAWQPRSLGPWSPPPPGLPARGWIERCPIIGWWVLRREAPWHGRGFWIRPMLLELLIGLCFAGLYHLEIERLVLWPSGLGAAAPDPAVAHAQYLSHIILISLMTVATFIDLDEQMIPDEVTVTGTVTALLLLTALPHAQLPTLYEPGLGPPSSHLQVLTSSTTSLDWSAGLGGPFSWPPALDRFTGLVIGLAGVWAWSLAIMHKTWTTRHGYAKAVQYALASIRRRATWRLPLLLGLLLSLLVLATWWWSAGQDQSLRWQSLLSAIAGMCFGGGLIWSVRIIGGQAMGVEAMGFGDVTLMAMIGAFLGWQATVLIFFVAPLTAVVIAAVQRLVAGQQRIAFGPYLCAATVIVILAWDGLWTDWARPMFSLGWFVPGVLACCLVLMGGLLWLWRIARDALFQ